MEPKVGDVVLLSNYGVKHVHDKLVPPRGLTPEQVEAWRTQTVKKPFRVTKILMGMIMIKIFPAGSQIFSVIAADVEKILSAEEIAQITPEDKPSI